MFWKTEGGKKVCCLNMPLDVFNSFYCCELLLEGQMTCPGISLRTFSVFWVWHFAAALLQAFNWSPLYSWQFSPKVQTFCLHYLPLSVTGDVYLQIRLFFNFIFVFIPFLHVKLLVKLWSQSGHFYILMLANLVLFGCENFTFRQNNLA